MRRLLGLVLCAAVATGCHATTIVATSDARPDALGARPNRPVVLTVPAGVAPSPIARPTVKSHRAAPKKPAPPVFHDLVGSDISWPECPKGMVGLLPKKPGLGNPFPGLQSRFAVIGVTNGPGFYPNPCLASLVAKARARGMALAAYANTTMPNKALTLAYGLKGPYDATTAIGRLQNASYAEAQINVASLQAVSFRPAIVWLDIETAYYLEPWSHSVDTNVAVIKAVQRSYADAGYETGFYASKNPWREITGNLQDPSPAWVTAGPRGQASAHAKCGERSFSGGRTLLSQWWDDAVEDKDLVCPGAEQLFVS